jgi:uncharacterized membrane protein YgcG
MQIKRLLRHSFANDWGTRRKFPTATLDAIEQAIKRTEAAHGGEIRFAIETGLPPLHILNDLDARARALDVFAHLRVWDTAENNGVLVYVQLADRHVEIVADRGFADRISPAEWEAVCRLMQDHYRAARFQVGSIAGVEAVGNLIARHFRPNKGVAPHPHNQLPDRPTLL